jgi:hypothetical protein
MTWQARAFVQGGELYTLLSEIAGQRGREAALAVRDSWISDVPRDQLIQAESALRAAFQIYSEQANPGSMRQFLHNDVLVGLGPTFTNPIHRAMLNASATALFAAEVTRYAGNPTMSQTWRERAVSMYNRYYESANPATNPRLSRGPGTGLYRNRAATFDEHQRRFDQNCREFLAVYNALPAL